MKSSKRIIWGIALVLAGVLVALAALGTIVLPVDISPWRIILGVGVLAILINGLATLDFVQTFVMAGIEIMIFEKQIGELLGKTEENWINNWTVLLITFLVGAGFNMIFKGLRTSLKKRRSKIFHFNINSVGDHVKYIDASRMHTEYVRNNFGDFEIRFENADAYKGDATLTVDNSFGDMEIFVPSEWEVSVDVDNTFGDLAVADELRVAYGDGSGKKLKIKGTNRFGDMDIRAK